MATIKDLYDAELKTPNLIPKDFAPSKITTDNDLTPYYSEGKNGKDAKAIDEKTISSLETKLSTKRYGPGMGDWGATYNEQKGKTYSEQVKKD